MTRLSRSTIFWCYLFLVLHLSALIVALSVQAAAPIHATIPSNTSTARRTTPRKGFEPDLTWLILPPETDWEANLLQFQIRQEQVADGERSSVDDPTDHRLCVKECVMDHCKDICDKEWSCYRCQCIPACDYDCYQRGI